jgi:hypothetical protein
VSIEENDGHQNLVPRMIRETMENDEDEICFLWNTDGFLLYDQFFHEIFLVLAPDISEGYRRIRRYF